nr:serine/arginine repetitive matrix protein 1-like [Penaeus vannamei]
MAITKALDGYASQALNRQPSPNRAPSPATEYQARHLGRGTASETRSPTRAAKAAPRTEAREQTRKAREQSARESEPPNETTTKSAAENKEHTAPTPTPPKGTRQNTIGARDRTSQAADRHEGRRGTDATKSPTEPKAPSRTSQPHDRHQAPDERREPKRGPGGGGTAQGPEQSTRSRESEPKRHDRAPRGPRQTAPSQAPTDTRTPTDTGGEARGKAPSSSSRSAPQETPEPAGAEHPPLSPNEGAEGARRGRTPAGKPRRRDARNPSPQDTGKARATDRTRPKYKGAVRETPLILP